MDEIAALREEVRKLREEIAALKAAPQQINHYHYQQQPIAPLYPQPYNPSWTIVYCGPNNAVGNTFGDANGWTLLAGATYGPEH